MRQGFEPWWSSPRNHFLYWIRQIFRKKTSKCSFIPQSSVPANRFCHFANLKFRSPVPPWSHFLWFLKTEVGREVQSGRRSEDSVRPALPFRNRCSWLLASVRLSSLATCLPLNRIAWRLQMSTGVSGAGTLASCWQLSFLWGHQLTHSTRLFLGTPCFAGNFVVGFL